MASNSASLGMGSGIDALTKLTSQKFTRMDRNADGSVDQQEWKTGVLSMPGVSNSRAAKMFKQIDTDKNGTIDTTERAVVLAKTQQRLDVLAQASRFQAENALGLLGIDSNEEEAQEATEVFGQNVQKEARDFFTKLDTNVDGKIDKKEFLASAHLLNEKVRNHAAELFDKFDKNKDGLMDRLEAGYKDTDKPVTGKEGAPSAKTDMATLRKQFLARMGQLSGNYAGSYLNASASSYGKNGTLIGSNLSDSILGTLSEF